MSEECTEPTVKDSKETGEALIPAAKRSKPVRTGGTRLTKLEKGKLISIISTMLLQQKKRCDILEETTEKFNLSNRSIEKYMALCYEMIADRPMETIERARRLEYSKIELKQNEALHTRDWTELEKLKLKLLGLENNHIDITLKDDHSIPDDKLIEIVLENKTDDE